MSSGVSLSAGSLLGKQNLWALLADLKFSSRNVNRAATGPSLGSGKGFLVQSCWEWLSLPSLPPCLVVTGLVCAFPLFCYSSCFESHWNSRGNFTTWSLLMEPLLRARGQCTVLPNLTVGMFWSLLNLSYQFKLRKCLTEQGKLAKM